MIDKRYEDLSGMSLIIAYFRDHGITEEEILHYRNWVSEADVIIEPDPEGMKYVIRELSKMLNYRYMSVKDLATNCDDTPWAWPAAKSFQRVMFSKDSIRESVEDEFGIPMLCLYKGESYFFHVNKEIPSGKLLEKLIQEGDWLVYTYSD